jgi:predicted nucleic acid-binding protein
MDLVDTNLVSELRKVRSGKAQKPVPLCDHPSRTGAGVLLAERRDPTQGALLRHWLQQAVMPAFAGRILAVDAAVARRSAALHGPDPKPFRDGLIAATALVHRLVVVTRNLADFEATGVPLLNPWQQG